MNDYPFDEVPINGTAQWYAGGAASLSMAGNGRVANVAQGIVPRADLSMDAEGAGTRRRVGQSGPPLSQLEMDANATGILGVIGSADAPMLLEMDGDGESFSVVGSTATMVLSIPLSRGGVLAFGASLAAMQMLVEADGRAARGVHASSRAYIGPIQMDGRAWLPSVVHAGAYALGWTYAAGGAVLIQHGRGQADIGIEALAEARVAGIVRGAAYAALELSAPRAVAGAYRGVLAGGKAVLALYADTRDRRVVTWPSQFYAAPRVRIVRVPSERRIIRIQRDYRAIKP